MYDPNDYFTLEEMNQIRRLGVSIKNDMIPLPYKDHFYISTGQIWDIDTYTAEACKCLIMREDDWLEYIKPKLQDENVVGLDKMRQVCYEYKAPSFSILKKLSDKADEIIVCEAGRGIDVLLAAMVKPWRRIVAYDQDKAVLHHMKKYFKGELGLPFEVQQINSQNYDFGSIQEKTIVFATCHNVPMLQRQWVQVNENLIGLFDAKEGL